MVSLALLLCGHGVCGVSASAVASLGCWLSDSDFCGLAVCQRVRYGTFFRLRRGRLAPVKKLASKQTELIFGEAVRGTPLDRFRFSWSVCAWPRGPKVLGEADAQARGRASTTSHIPACARVLRTHTVANSCAAPRANHRGGPAVTQHHRVRRKCRVAASAPPYAAAAEPINTATEQDARR